MSTASKVLLILSVLLMPVLLYFSMRMLKTYESWGTKAQSMAKNVEQTENAVKVLRGGEPGEGGAPGVQQLRAEINRVVADRGRVWIGVMRQGRPDQTGKIRVQTDPQLLQDRPGTVPFQQAVTPDTLVFAFDDRPGAPGPYLGQFKVATANENFAELVPTELLSPEESKRLSSAPGPYSLYEQMPVDSHQTFAGLAPQALAGLIPKESVPEYQRSGGKAQANDPPADVWTRVEFTKAHELESDTGKVAYEAGEALELDRGSAQQLTKQGIVKEAPNAEGLSNFFVRPLRDYAYLFREFYRQRSALQTDLTRDKANLASIQSALADAQKEGQFLQATIADLRSDLKQVQRDAAVAKAYAAKLEGRLNALKAEVDQVSQTNRELAAQLAAGQLQAAERIEEQVSAAR